jgi:hypothetical protein
LTLDILTLDILTLDILTLDILTLDILTLDILTLDILTLDILTLDILNAPSRLKTDQQSSNVSPAFRVWPMPSWVWRWRCNESSSFCQSGHPFSSSSSASGNEACRSRIAFSGPRKDLKLPHSWQSV